MVLEGDPFETLASQIALAVAILALIALLIVAFTGRTAASTAGGVAMTSGEPDGPTSTGAGTAAGLAAAEEERDRGQELIDDMGQAADESGFGVDDED